MFAQQPISVALQTPAPPQAQVSTAVIGNSGGSRYTYWVVTNYPSGSVVSGPSNVSLAPGVLTPTNYVGVSWTAQSGATSYDLIRLNPPASFGGSCTACAVVVATTATSFSDNGGSLANYSSGSGAVSANGTIYINTRDYSAPQMRQIVNGADSAIGSGGGTPGPPGTAATIAAGTATGLAAGAPPTVTNSGSSSAAVFNFGIPAGATGTLGAPVAVSTNKTLTSLDIYTPQEITGTVTISAPASLTGLLTAGWAVPLRNIGTGTITVSGNGSLVNGQATQTIGPCASPATIGCPSMALSINAAGTGFTLTGFGPAGAAGTNGTNGANGTNGTNGAISTIYNNGSAQTVRPFLNLISGTNATVTCVDNAGATRTDCTVAATGGSGGGGVLVGSLNGSGLGIISGVPEYMAPGTSIASASSFALAVPLGGIHTASNLCFTTVASTQPATGNMTLTLIINGVDSALVAIIPINGAAGDYCDNTHTVSIGANSDILYRIDNHALTTSALLTSVTMGLQ